MNSSGDLEAAVWKMSEKALSIDRGPHVSNVMETLVATGVTSGIVVAREVGVTVGFGVAVGKA